MTEDEWSMHQSVRMTQHYRRGQPTCCWTLDKNQDDGRHPLEAAAENDEMALIKPVYATTETIQDGMRRLSSSIARACEMTHPMLKTFRDNTEAESEFSSYEEGSCDE